jgi:hypothetical protein
VVAGAVAEMTAAALAALAEEAPGAVVLPAVGRLFKAKQGEL